jgi:hypothetical protein
MTLAFTPACRPMLRGGLPHESAQAALALLFTATPALPAWPVAPQRSGRDAALLQAATGFPGLQIEFERIAIDRATAEQGMDRLELAYLRDERSIGALTADQTAGLAELLRYAESRKPQALKAELLGPISLGLMLVDEHERPLAYDPALREALLHHLALRLGWLHEQLSFQGGKALICIDEPFLSGLELPFAPLDHDESFDLLGRFLSTLPGSIGLCIDTTPVWPDLLALPVDLVVFNAYEHSADLVPVAAAVAGYLDRGGCLGWGIVPADPAALTRERTETLTRRFISAVDHLAAAANLTTQRIIEAALITTSASLAALSVEQAETALHLCAAVAHAVRETYGLTEDS